MGGSLRGRQRAASVPSGQYRDNDLDDFHDFIDQAGSLVADAYSLNLNQVADEISSVQHRERRQLWTALAILAISSIAAGLLGRRVISVDYDPTGPA